MPSASSKTRSARRRSRSARQTRSAGRSTKGGLNTTWRRGIVAKYRNKLHELGGTMDTAMKGDRDPIHKKVRNLLAFERLRSPRGLHSYPLNYSRRREMNKNLKRLFSPMELLPHDYRP